MSINASVKRSVYNYRLARLQSYFSKKKITSDNSLIISGTPRGGTTWVYEVLVNGINNSFPLWEALHPFNFKDYYGKNDFWFNKYTPKNQHNPILQEYLTDILKGNFISERLLQKNNKFKDYKNSEILINKFCRLNEILPWFTVNFPSYKIVQIDRNPIAVISSQIKHGAWKFNNGISFPSHKDSYCPHFFEQFEDITKNIKTIEEYLTIEYCLSIIPRISIDSPQIHSVKYEDLYIDPVTKFESIFNFLGLDVPSSLGELIAKPSSTTKSGSNLLISDQNQLLTWKKHLSLSQVSNILTILSKFGFNEIDEIDYSYKNSKEINLFINESNFL